MTVRKTLPLLSIIGGNNDVGFGNDWWRTDPFDNVRWYGPGTETGDVFGSGGFDWQIIDNGSLRLRLLSGAGFGDYPFADWTSRNNTFTPAQSYVYPGWNMSNGYDIYFRLFPPADAGTLFNQIIELRIEMVGYTANAACNLQWYGFGDYGSGNTPYLFGRVRGDTGESSSFDIPWSDDEHRWVRWQYDASADTFAIYTAGRGGETWYQRATCAAGPQSGGSATYATYWDPSNALVEFTVSNEVYTASFDPADYVQYLGPWNPTPEPRQLPLRVRVGDPLVSSTSKTLPLLVDIGA